MRLVKSLCCAAALAVCLAPGARADEWNKKTILTFSGPIQIPGATLPAGTYVFKLADLDGNRHVVQVFDKDEKKIYSTILAIPDQKLEPSDKPVVMFAERPAGTPQAVKAWFYPGDTIGNEFVYPRNQAMTIARETHQPVLSTDEPSNATTTDEERREAMKTASVSRVDESSATAKAEQSPESQPATTTAQSARPAAAPTPTTAGEPAPAPTTAATTTTEATRPQTTTSSDARLKNSSGNRAAQPVGTSGQAQTPARTSLPRTASSMALFQLFGLAALAGGFGIRYLRTRFAAE